MTPTYIVSSNIEAVAYDLGKLYIQFKSGVVYRYDKVPFDYFDAIQKVESAGKFFHRKAREAPPFRAGRDRAARVACHVGAFRTQHS